MNKPSQQALRPFALGLLVTLVLSNLPFGGFVLLPAKLLATWVHELCHGMVMLLCGGGFDRMLIFPDTSGLAYAARPVGPTAGVAVALAGYCGTPVLGAGLLLATPRETAAKRSLLALAAIIAISTALTVENYFGQWSMGAIALALAACAFVLPPRWRMYVVAFIATQACINALLDIRVLFRPEVIINGIPAGLSDAGNMARLTFGTTALWAQRFWAMVWLLWSFALLLVAFVMFRRRYDRMHDAPPKPPQAGAA